MPTFHEQDSSIPDFSGLEDLDKSLEEIENALRQMQLLAELSASGANVDRKQLQAVLERLRDKINCIADHLE